MKFVALQPKHWDWVAARAQPNLCQDTKGVIAENDDGTILAAAILDSWSHTSCFIHIAIDKPMVIRHGFLEEVKKYVFETSNRKQMIGLTPADNPKALRFNEHVGMKEIFRLKDGYNDGVDYVVTRMTRDEWRQ